MTLHHWIAHEWRTRLSRPAALVSLALFAAALIYGASSGRIERDARLQVIATHHAEVDAARERWVTDLRRLAEQGSESGVPPWSGSAMDVTFSSSLPPAPLADFAIGQSDFMPYVGVLSLWDPDIRLFSRYEFEDPVALALGAFDLGKAVILVLPLVLIALAFDVLSAERDANRLGLTLAQGAEVRSLLWLRLLIRSGVILGLTLLIALLALILQGGSISLGLRFPMFAGWAFTVLLYGAFWIAMIGLIASRNWRGEINVVLLLLSWVTFTLILPAAAAAVAELIYPAPSRLAYLAEAREVEIETELAESDIASRFVLDHPDMLVDEASAIPAYVRIAFLATSAADDATKPVLAEFGAAASSREQTLGLLRHVSPAIIVHGLFNDITGTSAARHRRYMAQARMLKAAYAEQAGRFIVAGQRLPLNQVASLPRFRFEDEPFEAILHRNAWALLYLALVTGLLAFSADRRLRHIGSGTIRHGGVPCRP